MRRFIIDTDTASDDAVALVMALRHPDVTVEAITLVAGNVPVDQGVQNALYTVALCGAQVPVYRGAHTPLIRLLDTAQEVHGGDGMGDVGLPLHGRTPAPGHAVDQLVARINAAPGEITLVTLGPLTNVAMALRRDPTLAEKVARCVVMGGTSDGSGNATPVSEYNIWADPEAARIVFHSGMPLEMVGWDISAKYAVMSAQQEAEMRAIDTPLAHFSVDIQRNVRDFAHEVTKLAGYDLPDPIAMAVALDPTIAEETAHVYVDVETGSTLCRGQTVVDYLGLLKQPPNLTVVRKASRTRFLQMLYRSLEQE